jgi:hypothetical protein
MKNYYIDPLTDDVTLDSTNNLRFTETLTEYVSQKIINNLQTFKGEWYQNIDLGVPYYDRVLIKNPDLDDVDNLFQSEILEVDEVVEILEYESEFDNSTRKYTVNFKVLAQEVEGGETIEVEGSTTI